MNNKSKHFNQQGLTLLEILVAIIIFILASFFIVSFTASAIDKPKQAGVLSDFANYELAGMTLLKEVGNNLTEEETLTEFNKHLGKDLSLESGVSKKKSPYNEPYTGKVVKDTTQTSIVVTTKGRKKDDLFSLVILIEGMTVESCSRGFGKNDKELIVLESDLCDTALIELPTEEPELPTEEQEVPTEPEEPEEPEEPPFVPVTQVPAGCTGIYTASDMYNMRTNLSGCFIVMNPIDLSSYPNWTPVGKDKFELRFKGTFDGQMYPITNLKINAPTVSDEDYGLFGRVHGATFKNVVIESPEIVATSYIGALFGEGDLVTVQNIHATGGTITASGSSGAGGIVGKVWEGTIDNAHSSVTLTGSTDLGVLAGSLTDTVLSNSHAEGVLTSSTSWHLGGLVADTSGVEVNNSYSNVSVSGTQEYIGGLIGYATDDTIVKNSFSKGDVEGYGETTGGLIGYAWRDVVIESSYSTGNVRGGDTVGGLVGWLYGRGVVKDSYTTGTVSGNWNIGGLIGFSDTDASIINSSSNATVTGSGNLGGLIGDMYQTTVVKSHADGDVIVTLDTNNGNGPAGGFVGDAYGYSSKPYYISESYSTGDVLGDSNAYVGGFAGQLDKVWLQDVYSHGNIDTSYPNASGAYSVGGFAGFVQNTYIKNIYAIGSVKGAGTSKGHMAYENGNYLKLSSYYDTQTSGKTGNGSMLGRTTAQMKQKANYVNWDFDTIWQIEEGVTYPTFR